MTRGAHARRPTPRRLGSVLWLALGLAPVGVHAGARAASPTDAGAVADGLRIYRDGILPSGRPLRGTAQAGVERVGSDAACAECHRRSGYGASEGSIRIPPVTGVALYGWRDVPPPAPPAAPPGRLAPASPGGAAQAARIASRTARAAAQAGGRRRPPYDDVSLARAIRDGVDMTGRPLGPGMPRFALGDGELKALVAYLKSLSTEASPGVTPDALHLATVVQPGVDPAKRRAMLEVLQGFVQDKNAGTRSELQRRDAGTERMYRAYRTWVLHVWDLTGPAEGWGAQLDALYERQPVFALVGGLGATSWRPIHDFSERRGVPCVFPQAELPVISDAGFYTVYLSRGITLEAEALAKFLRESRGHGPVIQVSRRDETSAAAAAALRAALPATGGNRVDERLLEGPPTRAFWEQLAAESAGRTVVLWLREADLADAGPLLDTGSRAEAVYLSATLAGGAIPDVAARGGRHVRMVHPLDLPRSRGARLLRVKRWLHEKGIALTDEKVQTNAYLSITVTGDVVAHMAELFSRDYLVERLEHLVGNTVTPSIYPRVSLGPGQRFASKGSYIVQLGPRGDADVEPVSGWITP